MGFFFFFLALLPFLDVFRDTALGKAIVGVATSPNTGGADSTEGTPGVVNSAGAPYTVFSLLWM